MFPAVPGDWTFARYVPCLAVFVTQFGPRFTVKVPTIATAAVWTDARLTPYPADTLFTSETVGVKTVLAGYSKTLSARRWSPEHRVIVMLVTENAFVTHDIPPRDCVSTFPKNRDQVFPPLSVGAEQYS